MQDIEIAKKAKLKKITEIAKDLGIKEDDLSLYGWDKAKISANVLEKRKNNQDGKLILVTAINPTPLGEGKTTISIGLADGLKKIGKKVILALREPSLGPVFGIKGGPTGGGYSQIAPMIDINLHFTGDFHAITSANNLLSSMIDNHIYFGNKLGIKEVIWERCLDLNDRQLRKVECGLSGEKKIVPREDHFSITAASEIMAIFCLAENIQDLKEKLGNIMIGWNENDEPVYARDLNAQGAMAAILKDAIKPNLVQTLEGTPAIVHGGPFANIAHGCNTIIATKLAMKLADYTITEAGFGADLGAEKFFDIKCRKAEVFPNAVVCVATMKALKYHGGADKKELAEENIEALENGIANNLLKHIKNIKEVFGTEVVVAINKYQNDIESEIDYLIKKLNKEKIKVSLVESWEKEGEGATDLASKILTLANERKLNFAYPLEMPIKEKIKMVAKKVYGANDVIFEGKAKENIERIEKIGYQNLPICIAKTQYSFSDDPKELECKGEFDIHVKDVALKSGAGFVVVYTGDIMTMPGLPKIPAAEQIDVDENGEIIGIF